MASFSFSAYKKESLVLFYQEIRKIHVLSVLEIKGSNSV